MGKAAVRIGWVRVAAAALLSVATIGAACGGDGESSAGLDIGLPTDVPAAIDAGDDAATPADAGSEPDAAEDTASELPQDGVDDGDDGDGRDLPSDVPVNTPPTFQSPPPRTLELGGSLTRSLAAQVKDAEDPDEALTLSWKTPEHLTVAATGVLLSIQAPDDWIGTEVLELTVTDTGGLTADATYEIHVVDLSRPCDEATFSYTPEAPVEEVLVRGAFNNWASSAEAGALALVDDDADGTWEATLTLPDGTYAYHFLVDGLAVLDPLNPITKPGPFGGLQSVLFVDCDPASSPCPKTDFRLVTSPDVTLVTLTGDFVGWASNLAQGVIPLRSPNADGVWEASVLLAPGTHLYRFIVDGVQGTDPENAEQALDGDGALASVATVPDCATGEQAVTLSSVTEAAATGSFDIVFETTEAIDPTALTASLDWEPLAPGGLQLSADSKAVRLLVNGLADGIHDLRLEIEGRRFLLKLYRSPSTDWRSALTYLVRVDRFANGEPDNDVVLADIDPRMGHHGGDWVGLKAKIDEGYFDSLGVGALAITWPGDTPNTRGVGLRPDSLACGLGPEAATTPVWISAYDGSWPSDPDAVEERFGTEEDLRAVVKAAHARGIRVVLEATTQHMHTASPIYTEHADDGWFAPIEAWPAEFLAALDLSNAEAQAWMVEHLVGWVHRTGADGLRLVGVDGVDAALVAALRQRLGAEVELVGPRFFLDGERLTTDGAALLSGVGATGGLHGTLDYAMSEAIVRGLGLDILDLVELDDAVRALLAAHPTGAVMSPIIGGYGQARFTSHAAGSLACAPFDQISQSGAGWVHPPGTPTKAEPFARTRLALAYALTVAGRPTLLYGDEIGMAGAGAPDNQRPMRFGVDMTVLEAQTLALVRSIARARAETPALSRGVLVERLWSEPTLIAYGRQLGASRAIVVLNSGASPRSEAVPLAALGIADSGVPFSNRLEPGEPPTLVDQGSLPVTVPALGIAIYVLD